MRVLKTALRYQSALNLSVIPVRPDNKKPYCKWAEFQTKNADRNQITEWFKEYQDAMIAIVTGKLSGVMVIDCDSEPAYQGIKASLPGIKTWEAKSPRGYHLYFKYPHDKEVNNSASIINDVDIRGEGGYIIASPSINKEGKEYSWITSPDKCDLASLPEDFCILYNIYNSFYREDVVYRGGAEIAENNETTKTTLTTPDRINHSYYTEGRRDNDLFHLANCLIKGGCELDFATKTLEIIGQNANPPFPEREIKLKIESALKRSERAEKNISGEVREWVETTRGHFMTTDCHKELQLTTKTTMKAANMALLRLCEGSEPILERHGDKRGCYRKVEKEVNEVNFLTAPTDEFHIKWPLGIEDHSIIYPGNIIIVAGSKSSGKTGFLLNTVKQNMTNHKIVYLNSEMGDTEFRKRLELFEEPKLQDWKFKAIHRSSNFSDLITAEKKIFIVDFLEVTSDFWKVAQYIQEIHKKLKDGICIIGLQKSDNKETGRGGDFSKEKARLYLGLDYIRDRKVNRVKIVDAKAWRTEVNPRGLVMDYKLVKGSKFIQMSEWEDE
jgi:hypothetical protein